ncbi:DNA repair protein RecN [Corynebacterium bovis]|uniref:DNA repair protein RecN n=1 Tax=Corynebacterium bovis TaxID=36808 RepID=UPI003139C580
MLNELQIRNVGVIEEATAVFADGLTVVTGETGAGKTMVVTGLRLLSGHRADASRVRNGADKATVDGIFTTDSPAVAAMVEDIGGFVEDGEVIASRSVNASGRSRAHLAGRTVAAGVLGEFASHVITIHGQNDQLRLLDPVRQLRALDRFAGLDGARESYRGRRQRWIDLSRDLRRRTEDRRELALEADSLTRALEEIDALDPQPGEDAELKATIARLQDADDVRAAAHVAITAIDGDDGETPGASDLLGRAHAALTGVAGDPRLEELAGRVAEVTGVLGDISQEIGRVVGDVPDPDSLEGLLQRQQDLRELRKYAVDVDGVLAWRDQARERLGSIDVSGEAVEKLQGEVQAAATAMVEEARALTAARSDAARRLSADVTEEIRGLHMAAEVRVEVDTPAVRGAAAAKACGPDGMDEVRFMLVQGGHAVPLSSSASGGELSRVMLALEVILAGSGRTMVFDEVDAGVGGKAAVEIGRRLAALAVDNQVIVVTHLPQVAAFADAHLHVSKATSESSVTSDVRTLSDDERVEELSRMLAGIESETGRAHAEELLRTAAELAPASGRAPREGRGDRSSSPAAARRRPARS